MKISCMHLKLTLREAAYPQRWKRWVILNCHIPLYTHFSLQMKWNVNLSLLLDTMNRWGAKPHFIPFSVRFILEEHLRETGGLLYFQVLIFRRVIGQNKEKDDCSMGSANISTCLMLRDYLLLHMSKRH